MANEMTEREMLLAAVKELTSEVRGLRAILHAEYPKRVEMRSALRKRALTYGAIVLMVLAVTQIMTMTTISHCFLSEEAARGHAPFGCSAIPGYGQAVSQGQNRLERFYRLTDSIESNRVKTAELELEIEKIKQKNRTG